MSKASEKTSREMKRASAWEACKSGDTQEFRRITDGDTRWKFLTTMKTKLLDSATPPELFCALQAIISDFLGMELHVYHMVALQRMIVVEHWSDALELARQTSNYVGAPEFEAFMTQTIAKTPSFRNPLYVPRSESTDTPTANTDFLRELATASELLTQAQATLTNLQRLLKDNT